MASLIEEWTAALETSAILLFPVRTRESRRCVDAATLVVSSLMRVDGLSCVTLLL